MATPDSIAVRDAQLNRMILAGQTLEAMDRYYSEDVVMRENSDAPRVGKALNRERERQSRAAVKVLSVELLGSAVHGDLTFGEWLFHVTYHDGRELTLAQVSTRRWADGLVAYERFYYSVTLPTAEKASR